MTLVNDLKNKLTTSVTAARNQLFSTIHPAPQEQKANEYRFNYWQSGFNLSAITSDIFKIHLLYDLNGNMGRGEISTLHLDPNFRRYFSADLVTDDAVNIYNASKLYILVLYDYSNCYEKFEHEMYQLANSDTNVIGFNPANIGQGTNQNPDDYQLAIRSIIDNLHNNGIPHDNIVVMGHGFGAAIAVVVAAQYQEKNQRIKVIADRTFANLAVVASTKAQQAVYEYLSDIRFVRSAVSFLAYYLVNSTIRIFRLNIDAAHAFTKINRLNPGDAKALFVHNDQEIPENCSMARAVNADVLQYVKEFKCNPKLKAHYVNVRELMQHGEPVYKRNSGEFYVNTCLDHFKERMLNPGITNPIVTTIAEINTETDPENLVSPIIAYAKDLYNSVACKADNKSVANTNNEKQKIRLPAYS